ncbi:MAG: hypothetical protein IJV31_06830, partial [Clostridia bacterium]|nr:hypothetical protein [Clostridia bacterium]
MYARYGGHIVITKTEWLSAGLTDRQYRYDLAKGLMSLVFGDIIDVMSIQRSERLAMIEAKFGKIDRAELNSTDTELKVTVDNEARAFYVAYRK